MKLFLRLLLLNLALLFASCDYWQNLITEKSITKTSFQISIRDAWTGLPLPGTNCHDSAKGLWLLSDLESNVKVEDAATGAYHFFCNQDGYYPREVNFTLGSSRAIISAGMARRGGVDWYPLDETKKIGVQFLGNTHVPTNLTLRAHPIDTSNSLKYLWTFSQHPELNRLGTSPFASKSDFSTKLLSLHTDSLIDTVTFVLRAQFTSIPEYTVDSLTFPIIWVKNQKPKIEILGSLRPGAKVGCLDEDVFTILYQATDEDGECTEVRLTNSDTNTYFGNLNLVQSCREASFKQGVFKVPLSPSWSSRLSPGMSPNLFGTNHLILSVKDDNNETSDTNITFVASPHFVPTLKVEKVLTQPFSIVNNPVNFSITAHDSEATLERLIIDWGDSSTLSDFDLGYLQIGSLKKNYVHTYTKPGNFYIRATILNACGTAIAATLPRNDYIHVQYNDSL